MKKKLLKMSYLTTCEFNFRGKRTINDDDDDDGERFDRKSQNFTALCTMECVINLPDMMSLAASGWVQNIRVIEYTIICLFDS